MKRIDVLLRALSEVRARGVDARVAVVGTGDALPRVRELVHELGLDGHVDLPGFVDEDEKVRLLQRAHVSVQPSEKEGWGLTVIEANACGTPVIAADAPGLRRPRASAHRTLPLQGHTDLRDDDRAARLHAGGRALLLQGRCIRLQILHK